MALKAFRPIIQQSAVRVRSDNQTVVALIRKQGTVRSKSLHLLTTQVLTWARHHQIHLLPQYLPGSLNVLADRLSRPNKPLATEWSLKPSVVQSIFLKLGRPNIDLFATAQNFKLPTYVSPEQDPQAFAVDALSLDWKGMFAYAFPPVPLLIKVLQKFQHSQCTLILVAPFWPRMPWFASIQQNATEAPIPLPQDPQLLSQILGNGRLIYHPNPDLFHLHAWRISSLL